ncbi:rhomboid family intramembrane serine protease [Luethyella okanaganae]|uniref:Rhomboid family intramembrane serine protease n=1 Tax=Luethyella okanaganae TaxID=69372 RepID=A0ABW1VET9_9MICO
MTALMRWLRGGVRGARRHPVTLTLLVLSILLSVAALVATNTHPETLPQLFGVGSDTIFRHGHWYTAVTAVFFSGGVLSLVVTVLGIVFLVGASERLIGSVRTIIAYLVTGAVGLAAGLLVQFALQGSTEEWVRRAHALNILDPLVPVAGTIMAASTAAGPLWRRRIRVLGMSVLIMFLLYSGQPGDLYRVLAAAAGLLIGPLLFRRAPQPALVRSSSHESRTLLATLVAIMAVGPVVTIFSPHRLGPLAPLGELFVNVFLGHGVQDACRNNAFTHDCIRELALTRLDGPGPVLLTVLPLVVLVIAAYGLLRGRRAAVWLAVGVNALLAALAAFYYGFLPGSGDDYVLDLSGSRQWELVAMLAVSTAVPLVIAVLLFVKRASFPVRSNPLRIRTSAIALAISLVVSASAYLLLGIVDPGGFEPAVDVMTLLYDLPERFVPIGFLGVEKIAFVPVDDVTRAVFLWIGPVFWGTLAVCSFAVLRSPRAEDVPGATGRYRALRHAGGGGSLGHLGVWSGNGHWVSQAGDAAIAYRVVNGFALTVSEPVCAPERTEAAVRDFVVFCDERGWTPVFYGVHEELVPVFEAIGWSTARIGDEVVLRPTTWSMVGKSWQDVRSSINRAARAGIHAEWTQWSRLALSQRAQLAAISEEWVAAHGLPEMGFTLGGIDELADQDTRLMLGVGDGGHVEAVTSWMPSYDSDGAVKGWTLDFMRRRSGSINGLMEFLIAEVVLRAQREGLEFVSLSTAPFANALDTPASPLERVQRFLGDTLEPAYGFRSLLRFKRKFHPELLPLSMAYPDPLALPAIGAAVLRAYLPELSLGDSVRLLRVQVE